MWQLCKQSQMSQPCQGKRCRPYLRRLQTLRKLNLQAQSNPGLFYIYDFPYSGVISACIGQVCGKRMKNLFMLIQILPNGECVCIRKNGITADPLHPVKAAPGAKPESKCFVIHGIHKKNSCPFRGYVVFFP